MKVAPAAFALSGALLLPTPRLCAQESWNKKPFASWSEAECRKVLEDSPWAKTYVVGRAVLQELGTRTFERGRESSPRFEYRVQLRSALPVRQALVRREQLANNYDKLSPEQKKAFDDHAASFLGASFPDTIVVYVEYSTNVPGYVGDLGFYWRSRLAEVAQRDVRLIGGRGDPVFPTRSTHARDAAGFQLIFPRSVKEEPLIKPGDKELRLIFPHPNIGDVPGENVIVVFKVPELTFTGALRF